MPTPNEPTAPKKRGPKPRGSQLRQRITGWTSPETVSAINRWTDESKEVSPKASTGDTLDRMVAVCEGRATRPVLVAAPLPETPASS